MQSYLKKYLKYKSKYLNLKKMSGGAEPSEYCSMPKDTVGYPIPIYNETEYIANCKINDSDSGVDSLPGDDIVYTQIFTYLEQLNNNPIEKKTLIIKIGSNDTVEKTKTYSLYNGTGFINLVILRQIVKIIKDNKIAETKENLFMLTIDPEEPTSKPFNGTDEDNILTPLSPIPKNITYIKGCFPLATGSTKANLLLKLIIQLNAKVILVNAMGSACYRSFKAILDNKPDTLYLLFVDVNDTAMCPTDKIYDKEENYLKCKNIKDEYPEWSNSNLT